MLKKILNILLKIITICTLYILQLYVFNNTNFYGIKVNLPLVLLAIISIETDNKKMIYVYGCILGILSDLLFGNVPLKYLVINIFVVTILSSIKNTYKQDSKFSVIIFSVVGTIVFEIVLLVCNMFTKNEVINIFVVIFTMFKQCIVNVFFAYIIYLIWIKVIDRNSL